MFSELCHITKIILSQTFSFYLFPQSSRFLFNDTFGEILPLMSSFFNKEVLFLKNIFFSLCLSISVTVVFCVVNTVTLKRSNPSRDIILIHTAEQHQICLYDTYTDARN